MVAMRSPQSGRFISSDPETRFFKGIEKIPFHECWEWNKNRFLEKGNTKLTRKEVLEIRTKYSTGSVSSRSLGREYGTDQKNILNIVNRKSWRHL